MCPNQLTASITALAAVIAECRSEEEIALLAAVFTQLGDTLTTIAAQQALSSCALRSAPCGSKAAGNAPEKSAPCGAGT